MGEVYKFCYSGDSSNVKEILISPELSWDELVSSIKLSLQMSDVFYIELVDSSNSVVGERIADVEDFVMSCRYLDHGMFFNVYGLSPKPGKKEPVGGDSRYSSGRVEAEGTKTLVGGSMDPQLESAYSSFRSSVAVGATAPSVLPRAPPQSPPAMSALVHSSEPDAPDFTASLQSIMAGISKLENTIEFPSDYSRTISSPTSQTANTSSLGYATATYATGSMAGLKTSAEIEMERRQAEEEQKRQQALEDARKLRELLAAERAERERLKEAVHRKGGHSRDDDDDTPQVAGKHQQQQQPSPSMYGRSAGRARAPSSEDDEYEEEAWARAEEDKARRRAQEVERKMRVVAITSQRRAQEEEGIVSGPSPDGAHLKPMGGVRLPAMRLEHPVDISFRSVLDVSTIVAVQVEDQCDWIELTTMVGVYLGLDSPDKITHFILVDEDGDATSGQICDHLKFWKFHARRYMSGESMSFVVHHAPNDPSFKPPVVIHSSSKTAAAQEPSIRACGSAKGGKLNFRLSTDCFDDKVDVTIEADASWSDICGEISGHLKVDTDAVRRLSLFDDAGHELLVGIDSADLFWRAVEGRYSPLHTVFVVIVNEADAAPPASQGVSVFCSLTNDMSTRKKLSVPFNGTWADISDALVRQFNENGKRLVKATLTDDDGDEVFGGVDNEKKFWKAVNSRYDRETMFFVLSLENVPVVSSPFPTIGPKVSVLCRLSTETGQSKHSVNILSDSDWQTICSSITDGLQLEGLMVDHISLLDDDGDDVMGGITSDKKFWKAVNSRYSEGDMAFVVTTKKGLVVKKAAAALPQPIVPTIPLNFRLSTQEDTAKTVVAVPVDGEWESICAVVIESFGLGSGSSVDGITLLDSDGDEVLGSITSDKKFWKAAKRYNAKEMTFVAMVDIVASPQTISTVPTLPIYFRLSTDSIIDKAVIDIPLSGSWENVIAPLYDFFELSGVTIDYICLLDDDGDEIFSSIMSDTKFWKAVNNCYDSDCMVFVIHSSTTAPGSTFEDMSIVSFGFCLPNNDDCFDIAIPEHGNWTQIRDAVAAFFNYSSGESVTHMQLVDVEWDDVFSKISDDKKFWKAATTKYIAGETFFVVHHDDAYHGTATYTYTSPPSSHTETSSRVPTEISYEPPTSGSKYEGQLVSASCKLSTDYISDASDVLVPAMAPWDKVKEVLCESFHLPLGTQIDHVDLISEEGEMIMGNIVSASKFWSVFSEMYKERHTIFNIIQKPPTIGIYSSRHVAPGGGMYNSTPTSGSMYNSTPSSGGMYNSTPTSASMYNSTLSSGGMYRPSGGTDGGSIYASARRGDNYVDVSDTSESTKSFGRGQSLNTSNHSVLSAATDRTSLEIEIATFLSACGDGDVAAVTDILHKGADSNMKDSAGLTGLHVACIRGSLKVVELLVEKEASISCRDMDGMTPLHFCCENDHTQIAIYIVRMGGDTSLRNKSGLTSLHYICMNGNMQLTVLIRDYMINVATSTGLTLLHCAADMGHEEMVDYLVEHGAQLQPRDDEGLTPLHMAAMGGHIGVVEILIDYGAYWNVRDAEGNSPLLLAAKEGNADMVECLMEYGGNVMARNDKGESALHLACEAGSMDLAKLLLERNLDVNCRNRKGETPLDVASVNGHDHLVEWMEDRGAIMVPETPDEATTRAKVEAKTEQAARAFEEEEELNLQRGQADEHKRSDREHTLTR